MLSCKSRLEVTFMDYFLAALGAIFILAAFLGCFVPVIPGPPLGFAGLICAHFTRWGNYEAKILIGIAAAVVIAAILDYVLPLWATKKFGGSKRGIWGATLGMVLGLIFFPPWGIIIGPFVGAFIGEYTDKENRDKALKSAFGAFIGIVFSMGLKLAVVGVIAYYYVAKIFF